MKQKHQNFLFSHEFLLPFFNNHTAECRTRYFVSLTSLAPSIFSVPISLTHKDQAGIFSRGKLQLLGHKIHSVECCYYIHIALK